jgi:ubiquinone biosynthesis protein
VLVREMLEELGPTFTKLGQLVAGRPDLLPERYGRELARLRDHVTPLPPDVALGVLRAAYEAPLDDVFATIAPEPFAAASIGQVHLGTLTDGRTVAVKIRRPDAPRLIGADLTILAAGARTVHRLVPRARRFELPVLVDEFARAQRDEVDYVLEATHGNEIRERLSGLPWLTVPDMILPLCRPDVLVMDFVDGVPLTDSARIDAAGFDRRKIGTEIIAANLQLILFSDVFHADPHPGNYLVTTDERLAMLDFGQVGHSTAATRTSLLQLLSALITSDVARTAQAVVLICGASPADTDALGRDVSALFTGLTSRPLGEVRIGTVFRDLLAVLDRHQLSLPTEMTMLVKAVIECETTAEEVHRGLRLAEIIPLALSRPQVRR